MAVTVCPLVVLHFAVGVQGRSPVWYLAGASSALVAPAPTGATNESPRCQPWERAALLGPALKGRQRAAQGASPARKRRTDCRPQTSADGSAKSSEQLCSFDRWTWVERQRWAGAPIIGFTSPWLAPWATVFRPLRGLDGTPDASARPIGGLGEGPHQTCPGAKVVAAGSRRVYSVRAPVEKRTLVALG